MINMLLNDQHITWDALNNDERPTLIALNTNGRGYWSTKTKEVRVTAFTVPYINYEGDAGELRVHYNTNSWRTDLDGLIYTDEQFMQELREYFKCDDIEYSEQGMQGRNYVSCNIGAEFLHTWF